MAGESTSWSVILEDETAGAAESAASALMRLKSTMDDGQSSLREMQAQMRMLKSATTPNAQAIADLQGRMAATKAEVAAATAAFVNMGGSQKAVAVASAQIKAQQEAAAAAAKREAEANTALAKSLEQVAAAEKKTASATEAHAKASTSAAAGAKKSSANIEEMTALAKGSLGPLGGVYEKATLIAKGLGSGGTAGIVIAAAAAFAVLTTAVVSGYLALAKFAVTSNKIAMERLTKTSKAAEENVRKLFSGVHVEKFVALLKDVSSMLGENTIYAKALRQIIEVLLNPLFDAIGGAGPIIKNFFRGILIGALLTTIGVLRLKKALQDTFGDVDLGGFDAMKAALYSGVGITLGLVAALAALAAVGVVVAAVLALNGLFILAMMVIPLVILAAIVGVVVAVVYGLYQAVMFLLPAFKLVGVVIVASLAVVMWPFILIGALIAGLVYIVYRVADAFGVFGFIGGLVSGAASAVWSAITWMGEGIWSIMTWLGELAGKVATGAMDVADALVSGLVNGITSGASWVMSAIQSLADGAIGALKRTLQIASPSKVFASMGEFTAEGFAQGVDAGGGAVNASVEQLVQVPQARQQAASPRLAAAGGTSGNVYNITINGVQNAEELQEQSFLDRLADAIEIASAMSGGPLPEGA